MLSTTSVSRPNRSATTSGGIWSGRLTAGVPGRGEYWKVNAPANCDCRATSSVCWKSSSVSPGKPTMMSVVIAASGMAARTSARIDR